MRTLRIAAVEVPPAADDAFLAGRHGAALYRALRADIRLRFVEIGEAGAAAAFPSHAAEYECVRDAGEPEGGGGALLITFIDVPGGEEDGAVAARERVREAWRERRGYLGTRLYRSVGEADFRVVEITRWSSPLMYARALREREVADGLAAPFAAHAALYCRSEDVPRSVRAICPGRPEPSRAYPLPVCYLVSS